MFPILQVCAGERTDLEISLPEDLVIFARAVNDGSLSGRADLTVRLTTDLDLTGFRWVPIGFGEAEFAGLFDGGGHAIRDAAGVVLGESALVSCVCLGTADGICLEQKEATT